VGDSHDPGDGPLRGYRSHSMKERTGNFTMDPVLIATLATHIFVGMDVGKKAVEDYRHQAIQEAVRLAGMICDASHEYVRSRVG